MDRYSKIYINTQDCLPITCDEETSDALFYFIAEVEPEIFHFSTNGKEEEPIVYFDYQKRQWFANRYVGECEFIYKGRVFVLKIDPRFGHGLLVKLFEYIYSTKLPPSYHSLAKKRTIDLHKLVVSIIWTSHLKKALKHGLYKKNKRIRESGTTIRGKFLVKESLIDIRVKNNLRYEYLLKDIDNIPNRILYKAYKILKKNYFLNDAFLSNTIRSDFKKLGCIGGLDYRIPYSDYQSIKYSHLYAAYKPLIDLSWQIVNFKEIGLASSNVQTNSFYLDMAEVWELFVHRVLTKNLCPHGWIVLDPAYEIYSNTFFKRTIKPDLVLENNGKVLVVDAKYKRMKFRKEDVDREDVFQIHTYSYYFDEPNKTVFSTLVYPIEFENDNSTSKHTLFGKNISKNSFFIEGIRVTHPNLIEGQIETFVNSLNSKLAEV